MQKPDRKVVAGGALGTGLAVLLAVIARETGLDLSETEAIALAGLIVVVVQYFVPNKRTE